MTELHDRLADLASVADTAPPRDTAGRARQRSRRYRRRRRAGTAAIVALGVVVLATLGGVSWVRAPQPRPVDAQAAPGLPDRVHEPSRWLPGTADAGPLGVLAAVLWSERGSWTGTRPGLVGVSATTGEYRFLDLGPDAVLEQGNGPFALSPDGRRVAFWTSGPTQGSPHSESGPVTGVAVYDAVAGQVVARHRVRTDHGLSPDVLLWAGPDRLVLGYNSWRGGEGDSLMDRSLAAFGPRLVWDLEGAPERLPVTDGTDLVAAGPGYVVARADLDGRATGYDVLRLDTGERTPFVLGTDTSTVPVLDTTGSRVAVVAGSTGRPGSTMNPNLVRVGPVGGPVGRFVGSGRTFAVVGWADEHRVALHRRAGSLRADVLRSAVDLLDVRDGSIERLVRLPGLAAPQVATDLLVAPTRPAVEPARPLDPRVVTVAGLLVAALTVGSVVGWRRRVRP